MESKRIKSAWEIALERADSLGKLTPEEAKKQEEDQYVPIGRGLTQRYLGGFSLQQVGSEMDKHQGSKRNFVIRGLLESLVDSMSLDDSSKTTRALQALLHFGTGKELAATLGRLEQLLHELAVSDNTPAVEQEATATILERLSKKGISGSAIRANDKALNVRPDKGTETENELENRFDTLKEELRKGVLC